MNRQPDLKSSKALRSGVYTFVPRIAGFFYATKQGVTEVVDGLAVKPDLIIVDALTHINTRGIPYEPIIKGDAKCYNIAAASILAKVTRDRIMRQWDEIYPQYGFAAHKGYGTARHIAAIKEYGLCPIHRITFTKHFTNS